MEKKNRFATIRAASNYHDVVDYVNGVPVVKRGEWTGMARRCARCGAGNLLGQWRSAYVPVSPVQSHGMCPECRKKELKKIFDFYLEW